ncbi:MAG: rhodanese-like domain-containing protein [Acidobacteriaceae bacterium]
MTMTEIKSRIITPAALSAILSDGNAHELLDVRTPAEYASIHVPGARLAPIDQLNVEAALAQHRPGTPLYVLCHAGSRASKAIERFQRAGCGDCVLVEGGTQAWIEAGLPVHRGARSVLPLMRQVQIVVGSLSAAGAGLALTVNLWFAILPLLVGCGLLVAGITGTCGMALLLAKMPWNRGQNHSSDCCTQE